MVNLVRMVSLWLAYGWGQILALLMVNIFSDFLKLLLLYCNKTLENSYFGADNPSYFF